MELKPSRDKTGKKPQLDGIGNSVLPEDHKNPFATIARGLAPGGGNGKRRRPFADTLGATPPRDGPFAQGAADIAVQKPPRTRQKRNTDAGGSLPWQLPRVGSGLGRKKT